MATRNSILDDGTSQATKNAQPSKQLNSGSATISGANPTSPSTNNATRREQYSLSKQGTTTTGTATGTSTTADTSVLTPSSSLETITPTSTVQKTNDYSLDMTGNFDSYTPQAIDSLPDQLKTLANSAFSSLQKSLDTISSYQLASENYQYETGSSNVAKINNIINQVKKAYTAGIYDSATIANQLGVDENVIKTIQQGKASDLVTLSQDYLEENLKDYYRAEEDYNTQLARTVQAYNLAQTNLDQTYQSNLQSLKRALFNDAWSASVSSAVAGVSGSQYMVDTIDAQYQQNIDDLNNGYLYSSLSQRQSYVNAIEDYNTNMQRLGEDFDSAVEEIQKSVLQQFQELDNKIGLSTEEYLTALSKIDTDSTTAMSDAVKYFYQALSDGNIEEAQIIAQIAGLDTSGTSLDSSTGTHKFTDQELGRTYKSDGTYADTIGNVTNNIGHILDSSDGLAAGTYTSPNGYTYNVYATRQQGLQATYGLLQKGYYGLTLEEAAQKRIGKGKDISAAKKVIQGLGLSLTDKLSDSNVSKFVTAMGRWEGTLKGSETIEDWLKGGKSLSGYTTTTTSSTGIDYDNGGYQESEAGMYESYLTNKTWNSTKVAQVKSDSSYGSTEDERWQNFKKAAANYQKVQAQAPLSSMKTHADDLNELKNLYNNLSNSEKAELRNVDFTQGNDGSITWTVTKGTVLTQAQQRVVNLYAQYKGQAFIDEIIDSKQQGASYGALSDNEGNTLRQAASHINLNTPDYFISDLDKIISNITKNIEELGGTYSNPYDYSKLISTVEKQLTISKTRPSTSSQSTNQSLLSNRSAAPEINGGYGTGDIPVTYQSTLGSTGTYQSTMYRSTK